MQHWWQNGYSWHLMIANSIVRRLVERCYMKLYLEALARSAWVMLKVAIRMTSSYWMSSRTDCITWTLLQLRTIFNCMTREEITVILTEIRHGDNSCSWSALSECHRQRDWSSLPFCLQDRDVIDRVKTVIWRSRWAAMQRTCCVVYTFTMHQGAYNKSHVRWNGAVLLTRWLSRPFDWLIITVVT